jgi:hypothetical protein
MRAAGDVARKARPEGARAVVPIPEANVRAVRTGPKGIDLA